jgi:hypothetical protein
VAGTLSSEESRALKRALRAVPGLQQRIESIEIGEQGVVMVRSGGPTDGDILEARKDAVGNWTFTRVGSWAPWFPGGVSMDAGDR